jgi:hypothetical protein
MTKTFTLLFFILFSSLLTYSQLHTLSGRVTNMRMEPLAFVSVQVKGWSTGTTTKEDGTYTMQLDPGKYELVFSMIGYQPQVLTIVINKSHYIQNIVLEIDTGKGMSEVVVKARAKDRAEEFIRHVIRHKDSILAAPGPYSCTAYIKAVQQDSSTKKKRQPKINDTAKTKGNPELDNMAMAEIVLRLDYASDKRIKEERTGVTKRGDPESLFYLSTTDGNFNFYNNLIKVPVLSVTPFLSPISYSGLIAYRYKTEKTEQVGNHKIYTISVKPRQVSNATVTGELVISDSGWIVLHTRFHFPPYHLPEYDFFEVAQDYTVVNGSAHMITRQEFNYYAKTNRKKVSGQTTVRFKDFALHRQFPPRHFGVEVSATTEKAYKQDSSFWERNRTEPLTEKEIRFIRYKDSIYRATHTKAYLDSIDRVINRPTWFKILVTGQSITNHEKERTWYLPSLASMYQPLQFGGARMMLEAYYEKTLPSRKHIFTGGNISYGLRNHDVNGSLQFRKLYNPFNRGMWRLSGGREFDFIFSGDAWINMIKRSNIYLKHEISLGHTVELLNGLFVHTDLQMATRRSVSDYNINPLLDSLLEGALTNNQAVDFEKHNALYGQVRLEYTPWQRYIREPKEKIILGSKWPTLFVQWRKGIPGIINSKVNFDYLEFGLKQELKVGLLGISKYEVLTGSFLNQKELRLVDYKYQRRGDPLLFLNPNEAFQSLDSTFATFKRFYQGHWVHEFNGFLINKIPLLKKLQLREVAGAGFLIVPERNNLRYVEGFAGIERVIKWPFNPLYKFKLGVYVVGSAANQFNNPIQFKIGVTSWDRRTNKWY